jgi:hypothetical protein
VISCIEGSRRKKKLFYDREDFAITLAGRRRRPQFGAKHIHDDRGILLPGCCPEGREFYEIAKVMGERMKINRILFQIAGMVVFCSVAWAHPGHGDPRWTNSILHYVFETEHALLIAMAGATGLISGAIVAKRYTRFQTIAAARRTWERARIHR